MRFFRIASRLFGAALLATAGIVMGLATPSQAQDKLLFCNNPEKIRMPGTYAEATLTAGTSYTIFFHYKNVTPAAGDLVVAFQGPEGEPLRLNVRKGMAEAQGNPSLAGRQAMARFLSGTSRIYTGNGGARFPLTLGRRKVASGVLQVRTDKDVRFRIYYRHSKWSVPGAHVVAVDAPRREVEVALSPEARWQTFRIGIPEEGMSKHLDGTYGMLYAFKVAAPPGRKVRVSFSPRGGQAGMVGSVNGALKQTAIVPAWKWKVFWESVVGSNGLTLTTSPFGGVFYPVELVFQLM